MPSHFKINAGVTMRMSRLFQFLFHFNTIYQDSGYHFYDFTFNITLEISNYAKKIRP
jgi:hypothetical protein